MGKPEVQIDSILTSETGLISASKKTPSWQENAVFSIGTLPTRKNFEIHNYSTTFVSSHKPKVYKRAAYVLFK